MFGGYHVTWYGQRNHRCDGKNQLRNTKRIGMYLINLWWWLTLKIEGSGQTLICLIIHKWFKNVWTPWQLNLSTNCPPIAHRYHLRNGFDPPPQPCQVIVPIQFFFFYKETDYCNNVLLLPNKMSDWYNLEYRSKLLFKKAFLERPSPSDTPCEFINWEGKWEELTHHVTDEQPHSRAVLKQHSQTGSLTVPFQPFGELDNKKLPYCDTDGIAKQPHDRTVLKQQGLMTVLFQPFDELDNKILPYCGADGIFNVTQNSKL